MPKDGVDTQLAHFVDEHHEVMTKHLAKRFVDHRNIRLAAERIAKLPLHHAESGLYIRTLMVVLDELIAAEHEVVKHLLPCPTNATSRVGFECDEWSAASINNGLSFRRPPYPLSAETSAIWKLLAVVLTIGAKNGASPACLSPISIAVTMLVFTPHMRWHFTHSCSD